MPTNNTEALERRPSKSIPCPAGNSDAEAFQNAATLICSPELAALRVISAVDGDGQLKDLFDVPSLMEQLRNQAGIVQGGDLAPLEAMLANQAMALQSLSSSLVERALKQNHFPNMEGFMKLGLRAQSQCRATIETLANIKNPPVVYARQANIANGPQQINNGKDNPRAREIKSEPTKLLEEIPDERLDFGEKATAIRADQAMAPVGTINRAKVNSRQEGSFSERI